MLKNFLFNLVMLTMLFKTDDLPALLSTSFSDHIEAIIFDCDGVLVDTEYLKFLSWQKALASLNIELSIEEYKAVSGHTSKRIVEILQETKGISIPDEVILLKRIEYQKLQELGIPVIEDMVHFVRCLSQNKDILGIKLGLASSAPKNEILFNLNKADLEKVFDVVISGVDDLEDYVDPEGKNKPKPYIYLEAANRLNVLPKQCLVIEDTQVGIEAAVNAGMMAIAAPNWITKAQDFSKATKIIDSISELHIQQVNTQEGIFFKKDEDLERDPNTTAESCLKNFFQKGGCLKVIPNLLELQGDKIQIYPGDAIYPICSGGWCRSQALWAILYPFSDQIVLFPPHAARVGWDPYNGKINRYRNYPQELVPDEFSTFFGMNKALRFGFENNTEWKSIEKLPTSTGLNKISQFYEQYYFGLNSTWHGKQGERRVYIAFSNNAHVTLYRLNQSNQNLQGVTVIAIESEDLITYPPTSLNTTSRSSKAYGHFAGLLLEIFDLARLVVH